MAKENLGAIISLLYPAEVKEKKIVVAQDSSDSEPYILVWDKSLGEKPDEVKLVQDHEAAVIKAREDKVKAKEEEKKIDEEIYSKDFIGTVKQMLSDLDQRVSQLEGKK